MDNFSARAQFTLPTSGQLSAEAIRYLNALLREIARLEALLADHEARITALEP